MISPSAIEIIEIAINIPKLLKLPKTVPRKNRTSVAKLVIEFATPLTMPLFSLGISACLNSVSPIL